MRWGCCGSMISPVKDPIGIEILDSLAEVGFDYVELSLADLSALPEDEFAGLVRRLEHSAIRCEACNNFFPRRIRLTGHEARLPDALEYAARAMERAARLGVEILVFGSAGAKNVPDGFSHAAAWDQIANLLRALGPLAEQNDLTIAIEPINRLEANIVNLAAEGLQLAREVNHPNVQLLVDFYHLMMEHEGLAVITEAGPAIRHLHFAQGEDRVFPREEQPLFRDFFRALQTIRYEGRCSIEAYSSEFTGDARKALAVMRSLSRRHPQSASS